KCVSGQDLPGSAVSYGGSDSYVEYTTCAVVRCVPNHALIECLAAYSDAQCEAAAIRLRGRSGAVRVCNPGIVIAVGNRLYATLATVVTCDRNLRHVVRVPVLSDNCVVVDTDK